MVFRRFLGFFLVLLIMGCASSTKPDSAQPVFRNPLHGAVYSPFSLAVDRSKGHTRIHHGIDISAPLYTPIRAAAAGRVLVAETQSGYGKVVILDHGGGWQTRYAHLSKFEIQQGASVAPGEKIGLVGKTGNATGPHLHFEIRRFSRPLNPQSFLN